ncbi:hypothetical protein J3R74_000750 [Puniceicoccus vermicola]
MSAARNLSDPRADSASEVPTGRAGVGMRTTEVMRVRDDGIFLTLVISRWERVGCTDFSRLRRIGKVVGASLLPRAGD